MELKPLSINEEAILVSIEYVNNKISFPVLTNKSLIHLIIKASRFLSIDLEYLNLFYLNSVNLIDEKTFSYIEKKSSQILSEVFNKKKVIFLKADKLEKPRKSFSLQYSDVIICSCEDYKCEYILRKSYVIKCSKCAELIDSYKETDKERKIHIDQFDYKATLQTYITQLSEDIEKINGYYKRSNLLLNSADNPNKIKLELLHKEALIKYEKIKNQVSSADFLIFSDEFILNCNELFNIEILIKQIKDEAKLLFGKVLSSPSKQIKLSNLRSQNKQTSSGLLKPTEFNSNFLSTNINLKPKHKLYSNKNVINIYNNFNINISNTNQIKSIIEEVNNNSAHPTKFNFVIKSSDLKSVEELNIENLDNNDNSDKYLNTQKDKANQRVMNNYVSSSSNYYQPNQNKLIPKIQAFTEHDTSIKETENQALLRMSTSCSNKPLITDLSKKSSSTFVSNFQSTAKEDISKSNIRLNRPRHKMSKSEFQFNSPRLMNKSPIVKTEKQTYMFTNPSQLNLQQHTELVKNEADILMNIRNHYSVKKKIFQKYKFNNSIAL